MEIDTEGTAPRLLIEVCEAQGRNVVEDAHLQVSGERTTFADERADH